MVNQYGIGKASLAKRIFSALRVFPSQPQLSFSPNVVPIIDINPSNPLYRTVLDLDASHFGLIDIFTVPADEIWVINKIVYLSHGSSSSTILDEVYVDGVLVHIGYRSGHEVKSFDMGGLPVYGGSVISLKINATSAGALADCNLVGTLIYGAV